jgi:phage tail sheath protein FI
MEEVPSLVKPIGAVGTSTFAAVGVAPDPNAHLGEAFPVNSREQFVKEFASNKGATSTPLSHAIFGFFENGGHRVFVVNMKEGDAIAGVDKPKRTGLKLLEEVDEVAIVAAPGCSDVASHEALMAHAENMKDRVAILDPPEDLTDTELFKTVETTPVPARAPRGGGEGAAATPPPSKPAAALPRESEYAAFYFPSLIVPDALTEKGDPTVAPPSGHMAGIWARTDATRGVHKAPANEIVRGVSSLKYRVTPEEQGALNSLGVNCIRYFSTSGIRVWGSRTRANQANEFRYLPVRRLTNMIKESIEEGISWAVFEPNDMALWKRVRFNVIAFLTLVWRDGALMGASPQEAFFVRCDAQTNPPEVVDAGQLIVEIGIAPVKPAEFIIFRIGQQAGGAKPEAA